MNKKILLPICSALSLILIVITTIVIIKQSKISVISLQSTTTQETQKLVAKNKLARKGIIKETGIAQFAFTQSEKEYFSQVYEKNQSAALVIRIQFNPTKAQRELLTTGSELPFNFGILYNHHLKLYLLF